MNSAVNKLASFGGIGYPEKWHDYRAVKFSKDDRVGNLH